MEKKHQHRNKETQFEKKQLNGGSKFLIPKPT
jgi:hypothetical protein